MGEKLDEVLVTALSRPQDGQDRCPVTPQHSLVIELHLGEKTAAGRRWLQESRDGPGKSRVEVVWQERQSAAPLRASS